MILTGNLSKIKSVQFIDQNPIGRSSRSNPVTYLKVYDDISNHYMQKYLSQYQKDLNQNSFHLILMEEDVTNVKEKGL
jgi:excinuclease UvrABC ATPase subunit